MTKTRSGVMQLFGIAAAATFVSVTVLGDSATLCSPGLFGGPICATIDDASQTVYVDYNGDQVDGTAKATFQPYATTTLYVQVDFAYVLAQSALMPNQLCANVTTQFIFLGKCVNVSKPSTR